MASIEELHRLRWLAVDASIPYNPEAGILKFWKAHPELGSPLASELTLDDGSIGQAFSNGIVIWREGKAELLMPDGS